MVRAYRGGCLGHNRLKLERSWSIGSVNEASEAFQGKVRPESPTPRTRALPPLASVEGY